MRFGVALQECVTAATEPERVVPALEAFARRSRMPDLVPLWAREWQVDAALVRSVRALGPEVVMYVETLTPIIPVDTVLRFADAIGPETVVRINQEADGHWGAGWQDWEPHVWATFFDACGVVLGTRTFWCMSQPGRANQAGYWPGEASVVGFDRYRWTTGDTIDGWDAPIRACRRLSPDSEVWIGETGALVGTPGRAKFLRSLATLDVDVVVVMNLVAEQPRGGTDDWRWDDRMLDVFKGMVA